MAALEAALNELTAQSTGANVPGEVLILFPNWCTELPRTAKLPSHSLKTACAGLEAAEQQAKREQRSADVAGYAYARGALQAAINIHDFFGESSGSQGGVRPAPAPSGFQQCASGGELERLVVRLQAEAPPAVHSTFPNFCAELQAAARRPVVELRAAAARLEAAHGDVTARLFTEEQAFGGAAPSPSESAGVETPLIREAQALSFCVRAMTSLCSAKSAIGVADAVAVAVSSTHDNSAQLPPPPPPLPPSVRAALSTAPVRPSPLRHSYTHKPITSTRDAEFGSGGLFRFNSIASERADPFNPCCERDEHVAEQASHPLAFGGGFPLRVGSPERVDVVAPPGEELSLNGKLCGLPLKLDPDDIEMCEMEPPRVTPSFTALYTAEVDLSETGGTMSDDVSAPAWGSVGTGSGWD